MEQLDPIETLRFHMPVVLTVVASWRGRNAWDAQNLAPVIAKLQSLGPVSEVEEAQVWVQELQSIVRPLCGGIPTVYKPFREWLQSIDKALIMLQEESIKVCELVSAVDLGIRLGYDLLSTIDWRMPSWKELKMAIRNHVLDRDIEQDNPDILRSVRAALSLTTPRDKRTLIELIQKGFDSSHPVQLLLGRVATLLQRELRRMALHNAIRLASVGGMLEGDLIRDDWYWLTLNEKSAEVYIYAGKQRKSRNFHTFMHLDSGVLQSITLDGVRIQSYVPIAEAISRAQRAYCQLELEHGRIFSINAFMEFSLLRTPLRRLVVISQMNCEALDDARLNVLKEVQRGNLAVSTEDLVEGQTYYEYDAETKEYSPFVHGSDAPLRSRNRRRPNDIFVTPPQSLLVIGGGPTGLMTTIHCCESVLATGGQMKLYEARDAFGKGGSTFER